MLILPTRLQELKEQNSTFFINLLNIYIKPDTLHFAICDSDIVFNGINYTAFPVEIAAIKQTVDSKIDNVEITISDVDDAFKLALFQGYDFRSKAIEILEIAYPDSLSDPTLFRWKFYGYMDAPSLDDGKSVFKVTVKSGVPNIQPGRISMLSCNAEFGTEDCGKTKDIQTGTVQANSDSNTIYIQQSMPDGYWKNGIITINYEHRKIKDSVGNQVQTEYPFLVDVNGSYTIETGCDKSWSNCKKWDNQRNYSGFPAIPFELVVKT